MNSGKIVHQSSSYGVSTTSSGMMFSKKRELQEGSLEINDMVYISSPHGEQSGKVPSMEEQFMSFMQQMQRDMQAANQLKGYAGLSQEEKVRYRDTLISLNSNARLFIKDEETGRLRRCSSAEVKNIMDHNARVTNPADEKEAILVTRLGEENNRDYNYNRSSYDINRAFRADEQGYSKSEGSSKNVILHYGTSKLKYWDDLDFIDKSGTGVPGRADLPPSGSSVAISNEWERTWHKESHVQEGIFWMKYYDKASGGHDKGSYRPEEEQNQIQ